MTDVLHPGITGIELLRQVRQEDPDAAVIVMSGNTRFTYRIESLKLGAYAFLMKPVNAYELLITAERALERRQLLIERRHRQQAYGQPQADPAQRTVLIVAVEEDRPAVLVKPINMDELLITAERALEHRQLLIEHRQHQADT